MFVLKTLAGDINNKYEVDPLCDQIINVEKQKEGTSTKQFNGAPLYVPWEGKSARNEANTQENARILSVKLNVQNGWHSIDYWVFLATANCFCLEYSTS